MFRVDHIADWVSYEYNNINIMPRKDYEDRHPIWWELKLLYEAYYSAACEIVRKREQNG